ncbi:hypothetical protein P3S68_025919 [Capsicum galapagoense]
MDYGDVSNPGHSFADVSTMAIKRDQVNENRWLLFEDNYEQIGFWPQKIFTNLASFAINVEWGGVVYSPPGVPKPPMGASSFPIGNTGYDAYCKALIVFNDKGETIGVDRSTIYVDDPNLYKVLDYPNLVIRKSKHYVLYGGSGESHQL